MTPDRTKTPDVPGRTDHGRRRNNDDSHPGQGILNRRNFLFPFLYFLCLIALALIFRSFRDTVSPVEVGEHTGRVFNTLLVTWLLGWMAVGRLLAYFHLRYLGLWGATIHALYICSEMLNQQSLALSLSPAALVSLAGIGVVLLPLASRFTRFATLPLLVVVTIVLVGFPLMNIGNFWLTGTSINFESAHAVFQTNLSELLQFLGDSYSNVRLVVVFGSIALCAGLILWKLTTATATPVAAGLGLLLLLPTAVNIYKVPDYLYTIGIWKESFTAYNDLFRDWEELAANRDAMVTGYNLADKTEDRVTVLVIGESHNKQHMSLYGYPRNTTPELNQLAMEENLIVFENAWSNHTHTVPALTLALTEANQYKSGGGWNAVPSLLAVARKAGIATYWFSNQQMLGVWDTPMALLAGESDHVVTINTGIGTHDVDPQKHDDALLPYLRDALKQPGEKLIIIHLFGNHGNYCSRYPDSWDLWSGELELSVFGEASSTAHLESVNCYDNSIRYNDFVLKRIFNSLEISDIPAAALYFADHSEEIFNGKHHNSGNFDFAMADIPMFFTASDSWKRNLPAKWKQLANNRNKIFTNDLIFETALGLMGLKSSSIDTKNDLGSENYEGIQAPETLHGRMSLRDQRNTYLWQRSNAALIQENNLETRLLPHRVNTLGKMREIDKAGIRSYEVDVLFRPMSGGYFEVGRNNQAVTGMSLETWLEHISEDFGKVWLDIKNVTTATIPQINKRLLELDERFGLKNRTVIETGNESAHASLFTESGFHLSYYLPTAEILAAMDESPEARRKLATKLAGIAEKQGVSAVSYDLRLYRFVKGYLEPKLRPQIVYHTWSFENSFSNPDLLADLQTQEYFHDRAVETILLPWVSPFSL